MANCFLVAGVGAGRRAHQSLDLQRDALRVEGIDDAANIYHDFASGVRDDRPESTAACAP